MKLFAVALALTLTSIVATAQEPAASTPKTSADGPITQAVAVPSSVLQNENQKVLYTLGAALGRNAAQFNLTAAEIKYVTMGFKDAAQGAPPKVNLNEYIGKVNDMARQRLEVKASAQKKKDAGYIAKAKKEKGAKAFPSGLIYIPESEGAGQSPAASDSVKANYTGKLTNGTVFDSSSSHGGPLDFPLSGVIPCWTEGIQKMKVGGKARLVCPASIAYGDQGQPPTIPGGATLVFEVELVAINKNATTTKEPNTP